jgi:hypothetical protein
MGTRNLVMAVVDGVTKIAQYGQWDGYPTHTGVHVLEFARTVDSWFVENLRACRWAEESEIDRRPEFLRDTGWKILELVKESPRGLVDYSDFALDSLFCEWGYVLDFDSNTVEIYQGFNTETNPVGRWRDQPGTTEGYQPITLVKTYSFHALPSAEELKKEMEDLENA